MSNADCTQPTPASALMVSPLRDYGWDGPYLHYFTRDCARLEDVPGLAKNCTAITDAMIPRHGDSTANGDPALRGMLQLGIRNYIVPGTQRGPDTAKLPTPVVLAFTKR